MNPMALQARCELALARLTAPLDWRTSVAHRGRALQLAAGAAWKHVGEFSNPPLLLAEEPELLDAFFNEAEQVVSCDGFLRADGSQICWRSASMVLYEGGAEAVAFVSQEVDRYRAVLTMSSASTGCRRVAEEPAESLLAAIDKALALLTGWTCI